MATRRRYNRRRDLQYSLTYREFISFYANTQKAGSIVFNTYTYMYITYINTRDGYFYALSIIEYTRINTYNYL